jgi:hypothetical protein
MLPGEQPTARTAVCTAHNNCTVKGHVTIHSDWVGCTLRQRIPAPGNAIARVMPGPGIVHE